MCVHHVFLLGCFARIAIPATVRESANTANTLCASVSDLGGIEKNRRARRLNMIVQSREKAQRSTGRRDEPWDSTMTPDTKRSGVSSSS